VHCAGANFFLGEGLFCSSDSVIACPLFPIHYQSSRAMDATQRRAQKKNLVIVDNDAVGDFDPGRLKADLVLLGLKDVDVILHAGRKREDVPAIYTAAKVSLDCRNPGVEFINYEATLYDVITLACDSRATRNVFDFPVPSKYRMEPSN
jgi:hypothetical protein